MSPAAERAAVQLVHLYLPADRRDILDILDEKDIDHLRVDAEGRDGRSLPLPPEGIDEVLTRLRDVGLPDDAYTVVVDAETVTTPVISGTPEPVRRRDKWVLVVRPRMQHPRSLLFVPGDDEDRLDAARESTADGVILDLEDTVGPALKYRARDSTVETVRRWDDPAQCTVRMNGLDTPHGIEDVEAFVGADVSPDAVLVPDVRDGTELEIIADAFESASLDVPLVALIERPEAVLSARRIARSTPQVSGLAFGAIDFQMNMGMSVLDPETDVYPPRYAIAMAASATDVGAVDTVVLDTEDEARLREEATTARALGYDGKAAVTPRQAEVINDVFTPADAEVERARRLVDTFEAAGDDAGLVEFEGTLVDKPVVDQQRDLLERARTWGVTDDG